MNAQFRRALLLAAGSLAAAAGCTHPPQTVAPAPAPAVALPLASAGHAGAIPPNQLFTHNRQVLFDGQFTSFTQILQALPRAIKPEDAAKMLVRLDPARLASSPYKAQFFGLSGRYWNTGFDYPFSSDAYYNSGSYYFPYTYNNGLYSPLSDYYYNNYLADTGYSTYSPFYYSYGDSYYPYSYWY